MDQDLEVTRDEVAEILRELLTELEETVDAYEEPEVSYDAADAAEAAMSIALRIGSALVPTASPIAAVLAAIAAPVSSFVTGLVEQAQERSRTGERLEERISTAYAMRDEAQGKIDELLSTPRREFAERFRVWRLRRRVRELSQKITRLEGYREPSE